MYKVRKEDLIGDIKDFPIEVVQKMVDEQVRQKGFANVSTFQASAFDGFVWRNSVDRGNFWAEVIQNKNFDLFFERYPKKHEGYVEITAPDGYEVDEEKSTFQKVVFKKKDEDIFPEPAQLPKTLSGSLIYKCTELHAFNELIRLRNIIWEKQNWHPRWSVDKQLKWCIINRFVLRIDVGYMCSRALAFKDEDTAKKFLEKYRDLIEEAKYLI